MNTSSFDPTKPARTKSGLPARFLVKLEKCDHDYPFVFAVADEKGNESVWLYDQTGRWIHSIGFHHSMCLENIPVKHTREIVLRFYPHHVLARSATAPDATDYGPACIACKRIIVEFEEGEGL